MAILLIPLFYFCTLIIYLKKQNNFSDPITKTILLFSVYVFLLNELLSFFDQITYQGISLGYFFGILFCVVLILLDKNTYLKNNASSKNRLDFLINKKSFFIPFVILFIVFSSFFTALISISVAPNNYDSLTYHLGRIMHWIQNQSLQHFPTSILRQISQPPFSETLMMNLYLLAKSDRFLNLIQWASGIFVLLSVFKITKQFTKDKLAGIYSLVFASTLPMFILQSTSTQNDLIASMFLLFFVYFLIQSYLEPKTEHFIYCGMALGLASITKASTYFFALPWCIAFLVLMFLSKKTKALSSMLIFVIALAINLPHFIRNYALFKSPFGSPAESLSPMNEVFLIKGWISNIIRNIAIHWSSPFESINGWVYLTIEYLHKWVGIPLSLSSHSFEVFGISKQWLFEDTAGSPWHMLMIVVLIPFVLLFSKHLNNKKSLMIYYFLTICGFLLFCLIAKWMPWHVRIHMPLILLLSPVFGIVLSQCPKIISKSICVVLILFSLPYLFWNETRPALGQSSIFKQKRIDQYLNAQPDSREHFEKLKSLIETKGYKNIGVNFFENDIEYVLWKYLDALNQGIKIQHIDIRNASKPLENEDFKSDVVICSKLCFGRSKETIQEYSGEFKNKFKIGQYIIFADRV